MWAVHAALRSADAAVAAPAAATSAITARPATHSTPYHDIGHLPLSMPVAQRLIRVGDRMAAQDRQTELIDSLKDQANTRSLAWDSKWESIIEDDLKADHLRSYDDLDALLDDLTANGALTAPVKKAKRSADEARALRQEVKFHRVYEPNPSQPNPIATGFHTLPPSKLLRTPKHIRIERTGGKYVYMQSKSQHNTANFKVSTTGNPDQPGYIYTYNNEFAGNLDQFDKTGNWSRQSRDQEDRQYMGLGGQHKFPGHTVGHLQPFEHSPKVHDTKFTNADGETDYQDTDSFEHNLVIENPTVGEQIKRAQVEAQMMSDESYFMQYPVYPEKPVPIETTYNSNPITAATKDTEGKPVVSKTHNRPDKLVFAVDKGTGEEWAAFDNTGVTRYDTDEKKRKKSGYDTRTADWTKWRGKRVRPGMKTDEVWQAEAQKTATTPFPYLADIHERQTAITTYDPAIEAEKSEVLGYQSPPHTPYYGGFDGPSGTHEVDGFALEGTAVTTKTGVKGLVGRLINYDSKKDTSEVELEDEPMMLTK